MADDTILMTIDELICAVNGNCLCDFSHSVGFSSVVTDSRNVHDGALFIPLIGEFQDGHVYINKALDAGATIVLIDFAHGEGSASLFYSMAKQSNACIIMVENTLVALQDAARAYVQKFPNILKIGITGSSGKTTTKEIVASIFSRCYSVVMNEGNLNSETGLPLSVFKIRKEHQIGVFELGMNRVGEIEEIARVLSPNLAVITNIGTAHIGILGSQEAIVKEKKSIFNFFSSDCVGFVLENTPWTTELASISSGTIKLFGGKACVSYQGAQNLALDGTLVKYSGLEIKFPLPGSYNFANALAAIALAEHVGISPVHIKEGLESVKPAFARSQILRGDVTIILDCYNANPDSMSGALDFFSSVVWSKGRKICILGSMLELGEVSENEHIRICDAANSSKVDKIFLFGEEMVTAGRSIHWHSNSVFFAETIEQLKEEISQYIQVGDLVLLKGSRGVALERLCVVLQPQDACGAAHV